MSRAGQMNEMSPERWNKLKAKAQAGDTDAQWQVGSWLQTAY